MIPKEKEKIVQKYSTSSAISGMPRKLKRCTGKKGVELYIVEGDSALGSVVKARDDTYQMIYPIRGKIINAFNCTKAKFFSNEEVQAITKIVLGTEYRKNFDVSECKVDKVIFLADGDVDRLNCHKMLFAKLIISIQNQIAGSAMQSNPLKFQMSDIIDIHRAEVQGDYEIIKKFIDAYGLSLTDDQLKVLITIDRNNTIVKPVTGDYTVTYHKLSEEEYNDLSEAKKKEYDEMVAKDQERLTGLPTGRSIMLVDDDRFPSLNQ